MFFKSNLYFTKVYFLEKLSNSLLLFFSSSNFQLSESMTETLDDDDVEYARSCPNVHFLFPGRKKFAETIRKPLKNFVNNICPSRKTIKRKLRASEFQAGNAGHMSILKDMGITLMALPDGRVQLLHTTSSVSFNFFLFCPIILILVEN